MRCYCTLNKMTKVKSPVVINAGEDSSYIAGESVNCYSHPGKLPSSLLQS